VSDPQNVGALREMARLELDVGHPDAALSALSTLLSAEDKDVESHLLRAKINYQIKGGDSGLKAADAQLEELLTRHEGDAGDLLVSVLAHATFVKTQLGNLDRAIEFGERARKLDGNAPSALYALGRAYATKGDFENAKKVLDQAVRATSQRDQFYEPLLRAELATVQGRSGDVANAIRNGERAIEIDRLNLRAYFGLAALYAKEQKLTQAMTIMRKALANDPAWDRDRLVPTDYPTQSTDFITFADVFKNAKLPRGDETLVSLRYSAEGMIRASAGQRDEAEKLLRQALKSDPLDQGAVLYLSIIELEKGRTAEPRERLGGFIATTASQHPVTLVYMGRAEIADGDLEAGRKRLAELTEAEPTFVQARYSLAMVQRKQKLEAQATEQLRAVVKQDPDFLPAKRALDEQG
jgi:tetratricopeptide (TPR) repeat protein